MDPFTENILSRARERQRMIGEAKSHPLRETNKSEPNLTKVTAIPPKEIHSEGNLAALSNKEDSLSMLNSTYTTKFHRQNSVTRISSDVEGSPNNNMLTKTLNIQKDDFNMEIKVKSAENVRVEVEIEERENEENIERFSNHNEENAGLREESRNRLKRLGKLYAGGEDAEISSPIHRTEAQFYKNMATDEEAEKPKKIDKKSHKGLSKLADLAETINRWEDDMSHPIISQSTTTTTPKKTWKPPAPQPPLTNNQSSPQKSTKKPTKSRAPSPPSSTTNSPKKSLFKPKPSNDKDSIEGDSDNKKIVSKESPRIVHGSPKKTVLNVEKGAVPKQINWDPKVLDTLGGQKTEESAKSTVKSLPTLQENDVKKSEISELKKPGSVANKAAIFESKVHNSPVKPEKDPALLSLAERKALFEKNKGNALIPKAPFGQSAPVKVDTTMKASESKFIGITENNAKNKETFKNKEEGQGKFKKNIIKFEENKKVESNKKIPTVAVVHQAGGIANTMATLLENKSTISEEQIFNKMKAERQKEMDMLLNRFNKNKQVANNEDIIEEAPSESDYSDCEDADEETAMLKSKPVTVQAPLPRRSAEKRKSGGKITTDADSPKVAFTLEDVKRIKVSPPKVGRLYPNLSDIEATTTDPDTRTPTPNQTENSSRDNSFDSADPNTSFGRDILEAVCKNVTPSKKVTYEESTSSENSSIMNELDEILDEIDDDDSGTGPSPPKQGRHYSPKHARAHQSNSFHYKNFASPNDSKKKENNFQSPKKIVAASPRPSTELPVVVDGDEVLQLTHTVSFYRKQQNEVHTPLRQISRQPLIEESSEVETDSTEDDAVTAKIKVLEEEVNIQQNIIAQTSQALNLCSSTPEFSGSTEQVEAERVLLVASHRRQAALHELQRLRVERTLRPISKLSQSVPLEKGTLTISNIVLPMKQKYVTALAATGGKGHHVVCLIKCGEQVVPTKLTSTVASKKNPDTDLYIPGSVTLNNIFSDFTVTFEVYCLQAQEEFLPHEVKYHIHKKASKGLTTPKKNKQESRFQRPPKESPAGPQVVRTSSFALMGYVIFSVQNLNKKMWSLNNTPPMSPLEGVVEMKVNCELAVSVEHRGFLTMFEDISGFGAWHRRWCLLKGHSLSYWKYPDDEKKVPPIDTIDLKSVTSETVGPVSRDICARLHTFLLERERPACPTDLNTLVVIKKGDKTIIRHLLSADTKEERIQWCSKLNAALTAIRMWGNP
ncbi:anillin-like isoform X2 [Sitophilus oryzae]|uniref:Anillin-like isoform X2 n=1 Tax=Sitophilus oryzae TaxID=7048 RepID=A0A6J2YHP5_SITOR|nr:anillin-like isoform X2 [Sitophilus oryzae]